MPDFVDFLYTHAYFPQSEFDEVIEKNGWLFGRKDDAYIAVYSLKPARWKPVDASFYKVFRDVDAEKLAKEKKSFDYMAPGHANVWAIEMGSLAQNGSFESFIEGFKGAGIIGDTIKFTYQSPSQGELSFGWNGDLKVNGEKVQIHDYKRYENPFCTAEFNTERLEIECGGHRTVLDHAKLERIDD
jgi:hypothetical protein